ncbi:MAG: hypothetical protein AAF548_12545 [Actinomycetota bacterium]
MSDDQPDIDLTVSNEALDHARVRRVALGDAADLIEELIARPGSDPRWTVRVADALQGLRHAFDAHVVEVEGDDGLLPRLRRDAPRVANGVGRMEKEHITIAADLEATAALVRSCDGDCDADTVDRIRESVVDLLRSISRHRQKGADLVYAAYNVDIGGPG